VSGIGRIFLAHRACRREGALNRSPSELKATVGRGAVLTPFLSPGVSESPGGGDQPEPRQQTRTSKFVLDNKNSVCPNLVPSCVPILSRAFGTAPGDADEAL